jgi:chlorite dismutase
MNVVNMDEIAKRQKQSEKKNLLDTLEEVKQKIENDEIVSYVICSIRNDDDIEISACVKDRLDAIGLIEAGKMILFTNGTKETI